jgi:hypothetical protein
MIDGLKGGRRERIELYKSHDFLIFSFLEIFFGSHLSDDFYPYARRVPLRKKDFLKPK